MAKKKRKTRQERKSRPPKARVYTRNEYLTDYEKSVAPHQNRAFDYEKLAIEFSASIFRTLSWLHGGAIVAIPAAVALFKTDPAKSANLLVMAGLCFVIGLVLIGVAQGAAFFTMARRAESFALTATYQNIRTSLAYYPQPTEAKRKKKRKEADDAEKESEIKMKRSNYWRALGILNYWFSTILFLLGCWFGVRAIIGPI